MGTITIFYTGDIHGEVQRFFRLAHMVQTARERLEQAGGGSILVDSGGAEERTLLESDLSKGSAMFRLLRAANYTASAIGGSAVMHYGPHVLRSIARASQLPLLSANMLVNGIPQTPVPGTRPVHIIPCGSTLLGLIGLTHDHNGAFERYFPLRMSDPVTITRYYVETLRSQGCTVVGAISHLGYERDVQLAQAVPDLDFVIGGRSHTVLPTPANVNGIPIAHAGSHAQYFGQLDLTVDPAGDVCNWSGKLIPVEPGEPGSSAVMRIWQTIEQEIDTRLLENIGHLNDPISVHPDRACATGQLLADALRVRAQAELALCTTWHMRRGLAAGPVSLGNLVEATQSPCNTGIAYVSGAQIVRALEYGVKPEVWQRAPAIARGLPVGILQVSGMTYDFDPHAPDGARIHNVQVTGQPIDLARRYRLVSTDFEFNPIHGYFPDIDLDTVQFDIPWVIREVLQAHLEKFSPLTPGLRPRIRRVDLEH